MAGMSGTIYAANGLLSMSGNAELTNPLIVGMLNLSGNVSLTQIASGSGGTGDLSGISNTLLAGDLLVLINDPNGLFTTDERARIQDAINAWDAILAPYNVTITEVSDSSLANLVIDTNTTSACGGVANGVLGCYNEPNSEITMIQGWNWYAGADPSQTGAGQYDFETTVLHELGHALGLGGSTDPTSPMYEVTVKSCPARTIIVAASDWRWKGGRVGLRDGQGALARAGCGCRAASWCPASQPKEGGVARLGAWRGPRRSHTG
jgi:hypothetical protein